MVFSSPAVKAAESAGILPTNLFYFVKEIGWSIKKMFASSPIKKLDLQIAIADQKMAEIKKLSEIKPDPLILSQAAKDYQMSLVSLKAELETMPVKEISDQSTDIVFDKVVVNGLKHQKDLDDLKAKHEAIEGAFDEAKTAVRDIVATVPPKVNAILENGAILSSEDVAKIFIKHFQNQYLVKREPITKEQAQALIVIGRVAIFAGEQNINRLASKTDQTPAELLAKAKMLLEEAQILFDVGDYVAAEKKMNELFAMWRVMVLYNSSSVTPQ